MYMSRSSTASSEASLEDFVVSVYFSVWKRFYDWETLFCQDILESLVAPALGAPTIRSDEDISNHEVDISQGLAALQIQPAEDYTEFNIVDFDAEGHIASEQRFAAGTIPFKTAVRPSDAYHASAPCPRNIELGDDSDYLPFIPFADEPHFDWEDYMGFFGHLSWQSGDFRDPDLDAIELEVAHRLHFDHGISIEDIDATGVLSMPLQDQEGFNGLTHKAVQRDLLQWPGCAPTEEFPLPRRSKPGPSDIQNRVQSLMGQFCPNLNCIDFYCSVHGNAAPPPPIVRGTQKLLWPWKDPTVDDACQLTCFLHILDEYNGSKGKYLSSLEWSPDELSEFEFLMGIMAEALPCHLAVICRKPCQEVYVQRMRMLPGMLAARKRNGAFPVKKKRKIISKSPAELAPVEPCHHTGPCESRDCHCYRKGGHCERNCGCELSLPDVNVTPRSVGDVKQRVSAPSLSKSKFRITGDYRRLCTNCDIQRGKHKDHQVRKSEWGLGVFSAEPVKEKEFVAEYTGELVFASTFNQNRQALADYTGRAYLYSVNDAIAIDATFAGNHTRYINHSEANANCEARILLVNGEVRIGIYATKAIPSGSELLLYYGNYFFEKLNAELPKS